VLEAALALVVKGGYPAATIEAVAARSGVAKTTIYRWWPSRARLVVDLLVQLAAEAAPLVEGGDPLQGLLTELRLVARASQALPGRLLMSLLAEAEYDREVRSALREDLFGPRRVATVRTVRRAQASGALRRDVHPRLAADLFYGPLFYRRFIRHEPVTESFVTQAFERALTGLRPPPQPARSARRSPGGKVPRDTREPRAGRREAGSGRPR
jgi:AcrR family transcriptional regulator